MAKGRRLTTSRSERYLGSNYSHAQSNAPSTTDISEFREEDVWSVVDSHAGSTAAGDHEDSFGFQTRYYANGGDWRSRSAFDSGIRTAASTRDRHLAGGLSLAFQDSARSSSRIVHQLRAQDGGVVIAGDGRMHQHQQRHIAASAPVNVPDWKKILRVDSAESLNDSDGGEFDYDCGSAVDPPHEYLARSRNTAAKSVFEGVGRTLKGRDMSRLRDAVWSQTGFDG